MKVQEFEIEIIETLSKTIKVMARDVSEAIDKVENMYADEEIVLDASDFWDYEIKAKE